jgi:hypothetical protein
MTDICDVIFVDLGEGFEIKDGDRAGQIRWTRPPRARFECLLCRTPEGPVTGAPLVRDFVANIRADHRARCRPAYPSTTNQQGAKAA